MTRVLPQARCFSRIFSDCKVELCPHECVDRAEKLYARALTKSNLKYSGRSLRNLDFSTHEWNHYLIVDAFRQLGVYNSREKSEVRARLGIIE